jgi:hypothetical protein
MYKSPDLFLYFTNLITAFCYCSCDFVGTQDDLEEHLKMCRFEGMKDFLQRVDEKMADMQMNLNQKDQEIEFLRSMLGKLSERLETLEKNVDMKLGTCMLNLSNACTCTYIVVNLQ